MSNWNECSACGMLCDAGEYHPYAACLMFRGCLNGDTVRANLEAIRRPTPEPQGECQHAWQPDSDVMNARYCPKCDVTQTLPRKSEPQGEAVAWFVERVAPGMRDHGMKLGPFWKRSEAEEWVDDHHVLRALYTRPQPGEGETGNPVTEQNQQLEPQPGEAQVADIGFPISEQNQRLAHQPGEGGGDELKITEAMIDGFKNAFDDALCILLPYRERIRLALHQALSKGGQGEDRSNG